MGHGVRVVTGMQDDITDRADFNSLKTICDSAAVVPWHWHDGKKWSGITAFLSPVPRSIRETTNPAFLEAVALELGRKPDLCVAMELAAAPFIPVNTYGVPVVLDQVEVSGVARAARHAGGVRERLRARLTRAKHDSYWRTELARFDALTAVSEQEAVAVKALMGTASVPVIVAPNGVDCSHYAPSARSPVAGRLLFRGSLNYGPNREAVDWFVRAVLPKVRESVPWAHLIVTGHVRAEIRERYDGQPGVTLTGFVPDLRLLLASAVADVVPITRGGGTRLKILEAWASGVPVVSTTIGAAGLAGSEDGRHLILADTADAFAGACSSLLTIPELAERMARAARHLVEERYDWVNIVAELSGHLNHPRGGGQRWT